MAKEKDKYHIHQCNCQQCNEQYWAQKRDSKFCSKACSISWRNANDIKLKEKISKSLKGNIKLIEGAIKSNADPEVKRKKSEATINQWKEKREEMIKAQKQAYKNHPEIIENRIKNRNNNGIQ